MKKSLFLVVFVVTSLMFSSCSKDDDNEVAKSIKGTTWSGVSDGVKATVSFTELDGIMILESTTINYSVSSSYTYTYEDPIVTMFPKESGNAKLSGRIDGNTLSLTNTSNNKFIGNLTKK